MGRPVPGHFCQQQRQSAEAGQAGKQQAAANHEREDGEKFVHCQGEQPANGGKESNDDLHLAHERQNPALAAIDWQSRVNPGLGSALHQNAAPDAGPLQFFNGAARPSAGLAKHIDRRTIPVSFPAESGGIEFVERNEFCAGDMGGGIFAGGADIEQAGGPAGVYPALQLRRGHGGFGLHWIHNRDINI